MSKMNIKKFTAFAALLVASGLVIPSCNKDDIDDLKKDVSTLKTQVADLQSAQTLLNDALKAGKVIKSVTPITGGFKIVFTDDTSYEIVNGTPGNDGHSPVLTIKDGYWFVDGKTTNVKATGEDGHNPELTIKDGYWFVDGKTTNVKATGENGHNPELTIKDGYWFIDGETTNIKATGENGKDGKSVEVIVVDGYYAFQITDPNKPIAEGNPVVIKTKYAENPQYIITGIVEADGYVTFSFNGDVAPITLPMGGLNEATSIVVLTDHISGSMGYTYSVRFRVNPSNVAINTKDIQLDYIDDYYASNKGELTPVSKAVKVTDPSKIVKLASIAKVEGSDGEYIAKLNVLTADKQSDIFLAFVLTTKYAEDGVTPLRQITSNVFNLYTDEDQFTTNTLRAFATNISMFESDASLDIPVNCGDWNGYSNDRYTITVAGQGDAKDRFSYTSYVQGPTNKLTLGYTGGLNPANGYKDVEVQVTFTENETKIASTQTLKIRIYALDYKFELAQKTVSSPEIITSFTEDIYSLLLASPIKDALIAKQIKDGLTAGISQEPTKISLVDGTALKNEFTQTLTYTDNKLNLQTNVTPQTKTGTYTLDKIFTFTVEGRTFSVNVTSTYNVVTPTAFTLASTKIDEDGIYYVGLTNETSVDYQALMIGAKVNMVVTSTESEITLNATTAKKLKFYLWDGTKYSESAVTGHVFTVGDKRELTTRTYKVTYTYNGKELPVTVNGAENFKFTFGFNNVTNIYAMDNTGFVKQISMKAGATTDFDIKPLLSAKFRNMYANNQQIALTWNESVTRNLLTNTIVAGLYSDAEAKVAVGTEMANVFAINNGKITPDWTKYNPTEEVTIYAKFTVTDTYGATASMTLPVTIMPKGTAAN